VRLKDRNKPLNKKNICRDIRMDELFLNVLGQIIWGKLFGANILSQFI
jgi:hypothetical protein